MTKHIEPTRPIEAVPVIERVIEKPTLTAEQLAHLTNAKVLRDTAKVLKINGWTTGTLGHRGGPRCVLGAFAEATGIDDGYDGEESGIYARIPAAKVLAESLTGYPTSSAVIRWNDNGNTAEGVIRHLGRLARIEEELARG